MNRIRICYFCGTDDCFYIQIAVGTSCRADTDAFIRQLDMQRLTINIRMHGNSFNAEFLAGAYDPKCNFTAICNQNFFKHLQALWLVSV